MAETYPIQCDACGDIFDVAADAGERTACAMCGHSVLVAEAEEFELECPTGLVIEESTDSCLRLRWPPARGDKMFGVYFVLYGITGIGLGLLLLTTMMTNTLEWNTARVLLLIDALVGGPGCILVGLIEWKGFHSIELTPERLTRRLKLGSVIGFRWRYSLESIQRVLTAEKSNYFHAHLRYRSKIRTLDMTNDPERPRYIAHLLRRQLARMGIAAST